MENCTTCTFGITGVNHQTQQWAPCYDCFEHENLGACIHCLETCHKGHRTGLLRTGSFFCDCGETGLCEKLLSVTTTDETKNVVICEPIIDHPETKIFKLGNTGKPNPNVEKVRIVEGVHQWLENIFNIKKKDWRTKNLSLDKESVVLLPESILPDQMNYTHQGLIQYIFLCWAKEFGVVLKPDMFFFAVLSEIKNFIVDNPEPFRILFTTSKEKIKIVIVNLTVESLMAALKDLMPSKELFDIVTGTTFETAPTHYPQVLGITMADMGTPYYDYCTTKCGIPEVKVMGSNADWTKLLNAVNELSKLLSPCSSKLGKYLENVVTTLTEFIAAINTDNAEFLGNIFSYEKNNYCGSGHQKVVMNGWITKFYFKNSSSYITDYASHLSCLPYNDEDDPNNVKYYFYIAGLTSSRLQDGFLYPEYNIAHCQLVHPNSKSIFDVISAKTQ